VLGKQQIDRFALQLAHRPVLVDGQALHFRT
jgi:hypothetical protein